MALTKLGKFIEISDLRNSEDKYDADSVVGISTQKMILIYQINLAKIKQI